MARSRVAQALQPAVSTTSLSYFHNLTVGYLNLRQNGTSLALILDEPVPVPTLIHNESRPPCVVRRQTERRTTYLHSAVTKQIIDVADMIVGCLIYDCDLNGVSSGSRRENRRSQEE